MIHFTARNATSTHDMAGALQGRVHALAAASELVRSSDTGGDLEELIRTILRPFRSPHISGDPVRLGDEAISRFALLFYELATNAAKYGCLSSEHGIVNVDWRIEEDNLVLRWQEENGPVVTRPRTKGFGSELVAQTVTGHGGTVDYNWSPGGLAVLMRIPVSSLRN